MGEIIGLECFEGGISKHATAADSCASFAELLKRKAALSLLIRLSDQLTGEAELRSYPATGPGGAKGDRQGCLRADNLALLGDWRARSNVRGL